MSGKQRLSASVDADLLHIAQEAVASGRAESLSAWVNQALRLKAEHDKKMEDLEHFIAEYEAEHGEITAEEIAAASRRAKGRATVVRGAPGSVGETDATGRGVA